MPAPAPPARLLARSPAASALRHMAAQMRAWDWAAARGSATAALAPSCVLCHRGTSRLSPEPGNWASPGLSSSTETQPKPDAQITPCRQQARDIPQQPGSVNCSIPPSICVNGQVSHGHGQFAGRVAMRARWHRGTTQAVSDTTASSREPDSRTGAGRSGPSGPVRRSCSHGQRGPATPAVTTSSWWRFGATRRRRRLRARLFHGEQGRGPEEGPHLQGRHALIEPTAQPASPASSCGRGWPAAADGLRGHA